MTTWTKIDEIAQWRRAKREELLGRRLKLDRDERDRIATRVAGLLHRHVPEVQAATIGFYWPFRGELDFRGLAASMYAAGARLSLPVIVTKGEPLEFWHWEPGAKLARGAWGIPVPAERDVTNPTVLIVPLVGFDEAGYRLGYGGGYYDRTLPVMRPRPFTVGVGFELGRLTTIHPQDHDIPMDTIVTESGVVRFDANRRPVAMAAGIPESRWQTDDEKLDLALKDTFPASDPFSLR